MPASFRALMTTDVSLREVSMKRLLTWAFSLGVAWIWIVAGTLAAQAVASPRSPVDPKSSEDAPVRKEELPEIVARIDGVPISRDELWTRAFEARAELELRGVPIEVVTRDFLRSVLRDLIGNRLLFSDLQKRGLAAPKAEVDRRFEEVLASLGTPEERNRLLAARGTDEAGLRKDVEEAFSIRRWVERSLIPSIQVSEDELKRVYEERPETWKVPESIRLAQLFVAAEQEKGEAARSQARTRANELLARIGKGESFEAVVAAASEDPESRNRGGDVGFVARGQLPAPIEDQLFGLRPGEVSPVLESSRGFHIFRLLERRPARTLELEEVRLELTRQLQEVKLGRRLREIVEGLLRQSKVEILI